MCKLCKSNSVIIISGKPLCKRCFIHYFEKKVLKTIRKFDLLKKTDFNIGIAASGGKDSTSLLYNLNKIASKRRKLNLTAIAIDEGIKNYRNFTLKTLKKFCKDNKIELKIYSFKKEFGYTLDQLVKKTRVYKPCSICGTLRRYLLNKKARQLRLKRLATGHNLDDEAQSILINQFRNDIARTARLGPETGIFDDPRFIRRIKPFYLLLEKETATYAFLKNFNIHFGRCPYSKEAYRDSVKNFINDFEQKYPGTKYSIVKSFLEILPLIKKDYKQGKIKSCKKCKEPSSGEICNTCKMLNILKWTLKE